MKKTKNRVTEKFQVRLVDFEREGFIRREGGDVHILRRRELSVLGEGLAEEWRSMLEGAIPRLQESQIDPEVRRRELLTIQRLMEDVTRHADTGRGAVRLLPRGRSL